VEGVLPVEGTELFDLQLFAVELLVFGQGILRPFAFLTDQVIFSRWYNLAYGLKP
jgi:hypothetical protein